MKAIVYKQHGLPPSDPNSLYDADIEKPKPGPRDLLVKIHAIAVNPVDTKVRRNAATETPRVVGWDAVGTVEAVGSEVTLFEPGARVFYAGSIDRPGAYAEYNLVDERIAALAPKSSSDAEAAALPLTAITAWEMLFDRLGVREGEGAGEAILILGAAGGVGSIFTQLARKLTQLTVIGTASRPETQSWVRELGAHHVIDHSKVLTQELARVGVPSVRYVASLTHTDQHYAQLVEALEPQGRLSLIDDPAQPIDIMPLKRKCLSLHWELMFTRPLFQTPDMIAQHKLLTRVAELVDAGSLRTTLGEHFGKISAENLRRAHTVIESHRAKGKIVLEGF